MIKLDFNVNYKYEELLRFIEANEIEKLKCILENNKELYIKGNINSEYDLFEAAIKFNNLSALHVLFNSIEDCKNLGYVLIESYYNTNNKEKPNTNNSLINNCISLKKLIKTSILYADVNIFVYILSRFNIKSMHLPVSIIEDIFNNYKLDHIKYLISYCIDFKYLKSLKYTFYNKKQEYENDLTENILFNTKEKDNKSSVFNINTYIENDKFNKICFINSYNYYIIKYKSGSGLQYSLNQQQKILSFL